MAEDDIMTLEAPTDLYDPAWIEFNKHFRRPRSLGAAAADGEDDSGDGDDGAEDGAEDKAGADDGKQEDSSGADDDADKKDDDTVSDWRAGIEDEKHREYAGKFTTVGDLAKTALEFRQKLSAAIVPPGKKATEEDVAEFRKKIGVPESPEAYKIEYPQDIPEEVDPTKNEDAKVQVDGFLAEIHKAGATPEVAQAALGTYFKMVSEATAIHEQQLNDAREESQAVLFKEWGGDRDGNLAAAKRAAKEFGGEEFAEFLNTKEVDGVRVGDHPGFLRAFAKVGRRMSESGDMEVIDDAGRASIQEEINQIMADTPPGTDAYKSPAVQNKLNKLHSQMSGDAPIVGSQGRAA